MIALVIENESEVPQEVHDFCQSGLATKLFQEVEYNINSRNQSLEDLAGPINRCDCIIVRSSWMYKDQLEQFVKYFAWVVNDRQYTFYIWDICPIANKWYKNMGIAGFSDTPNFLANLRRLICYHRVISIENGKFYSMFNHPDGYFESIKPIL